MTTRNLTHEDWTREAQARFGSDPLQWAFVCPVCKHVTRIKDWKDAGAPESAVAFSCVGRWLGVSRDAFKQTGVGPCNYAGGGLFRLNPVTIIFNGQPHDVFEFADTTRPMPGGDS